MRIVICGLSITSSWGNGHATTYRALARALHARGHVVTFFERDVPWYAAQRDEPDPSYCRVILYQDLPELRARYQEQIESADLVIVGSYVPEGETVGDWVTRTARGVTAFYDIDTPVTIARLADGSCEYLNHNLIPRYDLYLSFTGGPILDRLEQEFHARRALPLYCAFDPAEYYPIRTERLWDMGYMGTYSPDRQPTLDRLLCEPASLSSRRKFVVAGPQYPDDIPWGSNVKRIQHLPPKQHRAFYNASRFTLNVTRADMIRAGYSPSVRLFEAAACGVPIVSDSWDGLDSFFSIGTEILVAAEAADVLGYLNDLPETERAAIGTRARKRVLAHHTADQRAQELEGYIVGVAPEQTLTAGCSGI